MLVDARIRHELTPLAVLELVDELPTQVQRIKRTFHFLGTFVEKCYFIHCYSYFLWLLKNDTPYSTSWDVVFIPLLFRKSGTVNVLSTSGKRKHLCSH